MKSIKMRGVVAAVAGALMFGFGANAMADSTDDILNALIAKGVLTEEEGALLQKGREGEKAGNAKKAKIAEKNGSFTLESGDGKNTIGLTGRLHFDARYNDLGDFGTGTVDYPYGEDVDTKSAASHYEVRRARIGLKGRVGGVADYLLQGNITGNNLLDEAYVDINKYEKLGLKVGKFKVPFGLEQQTSSNNIDFMERSYVDQNVPAKRNGLMLQGSVPGITYQGDAFQMNDSALSQKDSSVSFAGRVTANFAEIMGKKNMIMHAGLAGYNSSYEMGTATSSNTSGDAETNPRGTVFAFTSGGRGLGNAYRMQIAGQEAGTLANNTTNSSTLTTTSTSTSTVNSTTGAVTTTTTTTNSGASQKSLNAGYNVASPNTSKVKMDNVGVEGILAYDNFKLQGEYTMASYNVDTYGQANAKADVDAWYAEALWIITGENYADAYKKGAMGALKPKSEFDIDTGKGYGLWELGFRVDAFDVSNTSNTGSTSTRFQGTTNGTSTGKIDECNYTTAANTAGACNGGAKSYTAGLKWIWNPNLQFKLNYTHTDFDTAFLPIDIGSKATGVRSTTSLNKVDSENLVMLRTQINF